VWMQWPPGRTMLRTGRRETTTGVVRASCQSSRTTEVAPSSWRSARAGWRPRDTGRRGPPRRLLRSGDSLAPGWCVRPANLREPPRWLRPAGVRLAPGGVHGTPDVGGHRGGSFDPATRSRRGGGHLPSANPKRRNDPGLSIRCVGSPLRSPIEVRRPVRMAGPVPASLVRTPAPANSTRTPRRPFVRSRSRSEQARSGRRRGPKTLPTRWSRPR
jgi:hypothetical protein